MKKIFYFLGIAAMAVACQEVQTENPTTPVTGGSYKIEAIPEGTKTIYTPPKSVVWEETDELGVYSQWVQNTPFKFTKASGENTFSCESYTPPVSGGAFHVIYPYTESLTFDNSNWGQTNVTMSIGVNQTQTGIGEGVQSHINAPLIGYLVANEENISAPSITMQHVTTLIDVPVTNNLQSDITVTEISLSTESKALTGAFYVSPYQRSLVAPDSGTLTTATLTVESGTIASGATGNFYLITAPFTLAKSEAVTITVKTSDGQSYTRVASSDDEVTFAKGALNWLAMSINPTEIKPTSVTANQQHSGQEAENMIDDNLDTKYHTPWGEETWGESNTGTIFPVELVFTFSSVQSINYMIFDSTNCGRYPGKAYIYYKDQSSGEYVKITGTGDYVITDENSGNWDFNINDGGEEKALFASPVTTSEIKVVFYSGSGDFVCLREVKFYTYSSESTSTDTGTSTGTDSGSGETGTGSTGEETNTTEEA